MAKVQSTKICSVKSCDGTARRRGFCDKHYARFRAHGDPNKVLKKWCNGAKCTIEGCEKPGRKRGWCQSHYSRWRKNGSPYDEDQKWVVKDFSACVYCSTPIAPGGAFRRYCDRSCATGFHLNGPRLPIVTCAQCGQDIDLLGRHESGRLKYSSSRVCHNCKSPRLRQYVRPLWDRDGEECKLCMEPMSLEVKYPDPLSVSVDHILPRSMGGSERLSNLQLAHLICNVRRQNKPIAA